MPVTPTYPGVYVQELPHPVRPIVGVPTSVAAFVGSAPRGEVDNPVQVNSWSAYERTFGGLDPNVPLSYAVYLFFLNGGSTALVVRNSDPADTTATAGISPGSNASRVPQPWLGGSRHLTPRSRTRNGPSRRRS